MRRILVTSLLSLFLLSGTGYAYADHHRGDRDKDRKEWKGDKKRPGGKKDKHHDRKHDKDRHDRPGKHHGGPGFKPGHQRPTPPPPPPAHRHGWRPTHYNHAYYYPGGYSVHENLGYMISRVVGGGRDFNVWQVDEGTYVVRFRKGRKLYTQYLYPYEGRYGKRSSISLNWAPQSPWSLIPSIHLNFNL